MTDDEKVAAAVKSIEEFQAMLEQIREEGWHAGYAVGAAEREAELRGA